MDLKSLAKLVLERNASDLHISAGLPPLLRIDGDLVPLDMPALTAEQASQLFHSVMTERQRKILLEHLEIDFALAIPEVGRFRTNVFQQTRGLSGAMRLIPENICTIQDLGMPTILEELAMKPNGLILVTGPTGSGKSTTLAAVIEYINQRESSHIITIEDPIEYLHTSKKCLINQREVNQHTLSFEAALRSALREDPDIILVGEMRDLETIRLALTAAETGHLVFATLHTSSAAKTINRVIDVFPGDEKEVVRTILSEALQAVISQTLVKKVGGGRVPATEVMICTPAIRNLIHEEKTAQIYSAIQTGSAFGMHTLDQNLKELVSQNKITKETAREIAVFKDDFK